MSTSSPRLAHQFADLEQQHHTDTFGMWIFLATELMVFGALFNSYAVYRSLYPAAFEAGSSRLDLWYAGTNTIVLLTSSLTMALGVQAVQLGRRRQLVLFLVVTAVLGTAFLIIKGFEYHHDYTDQLVPGLAFDRMEWSQPGGVTLFLLFYYIMTGLHAVHLTIGIIWMVVLAVLAQKDRFDPSYYGPIEVGGLYWHFVDLIWLFLLPLLYLVR